MNDQCVAVCRDCTQIIGRPAVQPFGSTAGLEAWLAAHRRGAPTHDVRTVLGWPSPRAALASAFGEEP